MTRKTNTLSPVVKLAKSKLPSILSNQKRLRQEYDQMAEECYRQGYLPMYCIHGGYQWVDHDIPCHICEMYGYNVLPNPYELALNAAREEIRERDRSTQLKRKAAMVTGGTTIFI